MKGDRATYKKHTPKVRPDRISFVVLPKSAITKEQREAMGATEELVRDPDSMGFFTEFQPKREAAVIRLFMGKNLARDLMDLGKHYELTYDRICRVFFFQYLVLDSLKHRDDVMAESTFKTAHAILEERERDVVRELVLDQVEDEDINIHFFPEIIRGFLGLLPEGGEPSVEG